MSKKCFSREYSSSSSDSDEIEWNERKCESNDWLDLIDKNCSKNSKTNKRFEEKKAQEVKDQKIRQQRELNPLFRCNKDSDNDVRDDHRFNRIPSKPSNAQTESHKREPSVPSLAERNAINAKLLKAELMGNKSLVQELKDKLKQLESHQNCGSSQPTTHSYEDNRQLYSVEKRTNEESMSLKELFLREKQTTTEDETKRFVATTSKTSRYSEEEYEDTKSNHKKRRHERNESIIRYHKHEDEDRYKCRQCVDNIDKQLILSKGEKTVIILTPFEPFVKGFCQILSKYHSNVSTISSDEQCLREINDRKHEISKFFDKQNLSVIFMETYFKKSRLSDRHFIIDCIPIKSKYENDAKIFFKKAIMECESEWAMNKQVIEIKDKPITKLIPKGLPYFWVTIGPKNNGFAHVIEDEQRFPQHFGKEIIGGLLDIEPNKWIKPKLQNYEEQYKRVIQLKNDWNQLFAQK